MIILKIEDKEFKLIPKTRKVVELTKKLKTKNLNDLMFRAYNEMDLEILAEIIKTFAEYEDGKSVFNNTNQVYDFIDTWKVENEKDYSELFKEIIKVVNDMGFLKSKMTEKEIEAELENPLQAVNFQEIVTNSVQKVSDSVVEHEFKGYQA